MQKGCGQGSRVEERLLEVTRSARDGGLGKEPRGEQRLEALTAFVNRHIAVHAVIAWHALQVSSK